MAVEVDVEKWSVRGEGRLGSSRQRETLELQQKWIEDEWSPVEHDKDRSKERRWSAEADMEEWSRRTGPEWSMALNSASRQ